MTPNVRTFKYFNIISFSYGISCCDIKSKIKRRFLIAIKIFEHFYYLQQIAGIFYDANSLKETLPSFSYIFSYLCFIKAASNLSASAIKITKYANIFLPADAKKRLIKIELLASIIYIFWYLYYSILSFFYRSADIFHPIPNNTASFDKDYSWVPTPRGNPFLACVSTLTLGFIHGHFADIFAFVLIYCYLAQLIGALQMAFLEGLIESNPASDNNRTLDQKKNQIRNLRIIWSEIVSLRNNFESNLSAIPFCAMATVFVNTTSCVVLFIQSSNHQTSAHAEINDKIRSAVQWGFNLGLALFIIIIPFWISVIQQKIDATFESVKNQILKNTETNHELESLLSVIKSESDLNLTGWQMFRLNQEFVLAFLSSVITFSVLFMQLSQQ